MNNWDIMAPYARMTFKGTAQGSCETTLGKIPGCKKKNGYWSIPCNVLPVLAGILKDTDELDVAACAWGLTPTVVGKWEDIEDELRAAGEVRDFVLDGFLTHYQQEAIAFGWFASGVHYWHPTGSGKTLTGILCALSRPGGVIIVTRAASRLQYAREVERFTHLRPYVIRPESALVGRIRVHGESWDEFRSRHKGCGYTTKDMAKLWKANQATHGVDPPRRLADYVRDCHESSVRPVVVVGWEALIGNLSLLSEMGAQTVIYDESHRGKNSKRWDVVHLPEESSDTAPDQVASVQKKQLQEAKGKGGFIKDTDEGRKMFLPVLNQAAAAARISRSTGKRIGTTATPIKDRVRDLWAQLDLMEPNAWGNKTNFEDRYCDRKPGVYGGYDARGSSHIDELKKRIDTVAHILAYDETHRHLPKKRRQSVYLSPEDQCKPTGGFAKELRDAKTRGAGAVLETKLAQSASKKRRAVIGMVEDHVASNQKVVVFTGRKRDCDSLGEDVRKSKIVQKKGATVWSAHGSVSTDARQGIIDEYMAHPGPCVLVGTGHSFGESLNIHDTDAAFFVMLPYTPGQLRQWEGRFTRLGQKRPVVIYYVIAEDTVDEHIASILIDKLDAVEKVVGDTELAAAEAVLAGLDTGMSDDEWIDSVLSDLDL